MNYYVISCVLDCSDSLKFLAAMIGVTFHKVKLTDIYNARELIWV